MAQEVGGLGPGSWTCPLCKTRILGRRERANHMRNLYMRSDDPRRCDNNICRAVDVGGDDNVDYIPPLITLPCNLKTSLMELARRPVLGKQTPQEVIVPYLDHPPFCKNFCDIQDAWDMHVRDVCGLCTPLFWKFFLQVHTLSRSAIDSALHAVKRCFDVANSWKNFPSSFRTLQIL